MVNWTVFCKSNSIKIFHTFLLLFFKKNLVMSTPCCRKIWEFIYFFYICRYSCKCAEGQICFYFSSKALFFSFLGCFMQSAVGCIWYQRCNSKTWHFTRKYFTVRFKKMKMTIFKLYFHENSSNIYIFDSIINRSVFSSWFECKWLTVSVTSHLCVSAHCDL